MINLTAKVDGRVLVCADGYNLVPYQPSENFENPGHPSEDAFCFNDLKPRSQFYRLVDTDRLPLAFLRFAELELDPEAYRAFADKYGSLGDYLAVDRQSHLERYQGRLPLSRDFPLRAWLSFHRALRVALGLPISLKGRSKKLTKRQAAFLVGPVDFMRHIVEEDVRTSLTVDAKTNLPNVVLSPCNLKALLALQTVRHVQEKKLSSGRSIHHCAWCEQPFETGPGTGRRATKMYCRDKCGDAARYQRKKKRRTKCVAISSDAVKNHTA